MATQWDPRSKEDEARLEKSFAEDRAEQQKFDAAYRPQGPGTQDNERAEPLNPYLIMGFWKFSIIGTLMAVFFPWSLLFCVVVYGLEETKLIVIALVHDGVKTLLFVLIAILSVVVSLGLFIGAMVLIFG